MWSECNCKVDWTFFTPVKKSVLLSLFGMGMNPDLFQSCGHYKAFQICWHTECSTLTTSSFRIWKSSAWIPSPPVTLSLVMLPKSHLTSYCKMSVPKWVTTPQWLFKSLKPFFVCFFLWYSSIYSCHVFLPPIIEGDLSDLSSLHWVHHQITSTELEIAGARTGVGCREGGVNELMASNPIHVFAQGWHSPFRSIH